MTDILLVYLIASLAIGLVMATQTDCEWYWRVIIIIIVAILWPLAVIDGLVNYLKGNNTA